MGNSLGCFLPKAEITSKKASSRPPLIIASAAGSRRSGGASLSSPSSFKRNKKKDDRDDLNDSEIREQALAALMLFNHHQKNGSLSLNRSASVIYPSPASSKKQGVGRSLTSRHRSQAESPLQPHQLVNQDPKIEGVETKHFVLVHGGGFGAWCWYKTITLLQEGGFEVDVVDLTGSGVNSFDTNSITSLAQYVKPLTDFLEKLGQGKKVILVGHDIGGACVSYAMELFPLKITKAVFISAAMLTSGQSTLDMLSQQAGSNDLMQQAQIFLYGNGKGHPPTAIDLDKSLLRDLLFNQSSSKDVALASVSMRPIPFAPVLEKLSLSDKNYGSVRRFYIKTQEDYAIPVSLQDAIINSNPPEQVFHLKGSDHSPFFSRPQALHRTLVEISQIP